MHDIFDAIANPLRRQILDLLQQRDGRTLTEIEQALPLTRFGVMKHLRVLEEVNLVSTRKVGREKFHYLNPVPIQELGDRWISNYARGFTRAMVSIRHLSEEGAFAMSKGPTHVYEIYIRASADAVWATLTDDAKTPLWQHFDMDSRTDWRVGGSITFLLNGNEMIVGEILEMDPPRRLSHSFSARWSPDVTGDPPSKVTWEIIPAGPDAVKLVLTHGDFGGDTLTSRMVTGGWPESISRLKTLLETGQPFRFAAPPPSAG